MLKKAFETIKKDLGDVTLMSIDEDQSFVLETDASNVAISATLKQNGKPEAFFSRTLNKSQKMYPTVEKEAMSIVEAIRHWSHFLGRKKFKLINNQRALAYMLNNFKKSKIKNVKIQNWRLELSEYRFDVEYRPGKLNSAADVIRNLPYSLADVTKVCTKCLTLAHSLCCEAKRVQIVRHFFDLYF